MEAHWVCQNMKKLLAALTFAAICATASTIQTQSKVTPEPESTPVQAPAPRGVTRMIYNIGAIDPNQSLLPQAIAAVRTPEPNANFMIGVGLLGVAYLLHRKTQKTTR